MKKTELPDSKNLWQLKFDGAGMPHGTIETNRTCNIRCDNCYNVDRTHVKPFARIVAEIDLLASRRNVQTITLMGGEPTLHPDLPAIVSYVKSRGICCQILTNGVLFLESGGPALLTALRKSGVDRITLHVDKGQLSVHHDVDAVRQRLFGMLESFRIHFALSVTIDSGERAIVPQIVAANAEYRFFDGIVGFMASGVAGKKEPGTHLKTEVAEIAAELSLSPTGYLPSNNDESEVRWLLYYFMLDSRTAKAYPLSPLLSRLFCEVLRNITGRFPFTLHLHPVLSALCSLPVMFSSPKRLFAKTGDAGGLFDLFTSLVSARFFYIVFQVPPEFDASTTAIEMCRNCPDATVRNGMLLPLCLADFIGPFDGSVTTYANLDRKFNAVIEYLNPRNSARTG
jgi:hypothetical protein